MKDNLINVIFIIDESGSMYASKSDVVGGFKKVIDEQKAIKEGACGQLHGLRCLPYSGQVRDE